MIQINVLKATTCISFFCFIFLSPLKTFCQGNEYDAAHQYSVEELQVDFRFLRTNLEKAHPNLYLYTSKKEFDLFFDSLYNSIKNPLTEMEFYNLITLLNSKIKDGHTMFLPGQTAMDYFNRRESFFPFYIFISDGKLFVNMNCSSDTLIKDGAELKTIDGIKATDIINKLLSRQIRDGNSITYPIWILTNYFKEYFGFVFGYPAKFSISFKISNVNRQTTITALTKDSINYYRLAKYSNRISTAYENRGIIFTINKQLNTGTLTIKSFDKEILRSVYKQNFDSAIKKIFRQLYDAHCNNLILDVRNNQGGNFQPGKLLLSYLLRQPIKYLAGSKEAETISPGKNNFKGKLFVLINGGSFSSTSILCSYLELTKRAVFIGGETGGNKVMISGDPEDIILPNTKILSEISTVKYKIRNEKNTGHGIRPVYYRAPTIDDLVLSNDPAMQLALKLIMKEK